LKAELNVCCWHGEKNYSDSRPGGRLNCQ
jgi:hypothetical protein